MFKQYVVIKTVNIDCLEVGAPGSFVTNLSILEMDSLVPLSNFALRVTLFVHLQKLVYKEPNLKELIVKEVK